MRHQCVSGNLQLHNIDQTGNLLTWDFDVKQFFVDVGKPQSWIKMNTVTIYLLVKNNEVQICKYGILCPACFQFWLRIYISINSWIYQLSNYKQVDCYCNFLFLPVLRFTP